MSVHDFSCSRRASRCNGCERNSSTASNRLYVDHHSNQIQSLWQPLASSVHGVVSPADGTDVSERSTGSDRRVKPVKVKSKPPPPEIARRERERRLMDESLLISDQIVPHQRTFLF